MATQIGNTSQLQRLTVEMPQPQPHMFDPRRAVAEREMACAEDSEDDDDRFANSDWLA